MLMRTDPFRQLDPRYQFVIQAVDGLLSIARSAFVRVSLKPSALTGVSSLGIVALVTAGWCTGPLGARRSSRCIV